MLFATCRFVPIYIFNSFLGKLTFFFFAKNRSAGVNLGTAKTCFFFHIYAAQVELFGFSLLIFVLYIYTNRFGHVVLPAIQL